MFNKTKRVLALLLAAALVFSLAGCKKATGDGSSAEVEVITEYEYVEGEGSGNGSGGGTTTVVTSGGGSGGSDGSGGGSTNKENTINKNVDPEKYRGTTVKFAATIDPANDESGPVVKAFEEKYGIKVEIVKSDQGDYANQMAGLIAAGKSPDVARCNGDFPTCMGYLQSLDAAKLDYNESIWKQNTFKLST
ncbi:MAG: extracellular solute-binding protein, partial [Acutalibacteraceae bacterium]